MNKPVSSLEENNNKEVFEQISEYLKKLSALLDITYGYNEDHKNGVYWNETLFNEYVQLDPSKSYNELYHTFIEKIDKDLDKIKELKNALGDKNIKEEIAKGQLEYAEKVLKLIKLGIPFELEKAGKKHNLTHQEIKERVKNIETIDLELFDGKVTNDLLEINGSIEFLENYLNDNIDKLTQDESNDFKKYIQTLKKYKNDNFSENEKTPETYKIGNMEPHKKLTENIIKRLEEEVDDKTIQKVFQLTFEIYNIQLKVVLSEKHTSIYDSPDKLYVPKNKNIPLKNLLKLIQHEIETHYIISKNNQNNLDDVRGKKYLFKEEGSAKSMEKLVLGKELDNSKVTLSLPKIALGEIIAGENYKEFHRLFQKLKNKESEYIGKLLRSKRNYPLNYPGVQHKDTTYSRGCKQVVEYLEKGGDPTELFRNKVSFEDMEKIKTVEPQNDEYTKPLLLGELLLYALSGKKINREGFKEYIKNKYDFLEENHLSGEFTYNQKKKIIEILREIE